MMATMGHDDFDRQINTPKILKASKMQHDTRAVQAIVARISSISFLKEIKPRIKHNTGSTQSFNNSIEHFGTHRSKNQTVAQRNRNPVGAKFTQKRHSLITVYSQYD